ncbi:Phosphatidylethanolamine N-methyltransferase [Bienertia sinuspersici]
MTDQKPSNNNSQKAPSNSSINNKVSSNSSINTKDSSTSATIDQAPNDVVRQSNKRKNSPTFTLLQLNKKKFDGESNSNSNIPTDELTTTTPEVTPKFGSFNSGKDSGHGSSESDQVSVKKKNRCISEGTSTTTLVEEEDDKI